MTGTIAQIIVSSAPDTALPAFLAREQKTAVDDLLAAGHFKPLNDNNGPYELSLAIEDSRLVIRSRNAAGQDLRTLVLALKPYRRLIRDYFMMIESYETARRSATPDKLETIDMARRALHNEGAEKLQERLRGKAELDHETARKLFTLICVLHSTQMKLLR